MNKLIVAMALVAFSAVAFADQHETATAPAAAPTKMEKKGMKKMKKGHEEHKTEEHKTEAAH